MSIFFKQITRLGFQSQYFCKSKHLSFHNITWILSPHRDGGIGMISEYRSEVLLWQQ